MAYPARPRQSARIVTTNAEESAEAEVADHVLVKAKGRIICNVNQKCMFRKSSRRVGRSETSMSRSPCKELGVDLRKRKLRKTEDETNRKDTYPRERPYST